MKKLPKVPKYVSDYLRSVNPSYELPELVRTQWFSRDVNPEYHGVYEIECPFVGQDVAYAYWNGQWWSMWTYSLQHLQNLVDVEDIYDVTSRWRGQISINTVNRKNNGRIASTQ